MAERSLQVSTSCTIKLLVAAVSRLGLGRYATDKLEVPEVDIKVGRMVTWL